MTCTAAQACVRTVVQGGACIFPSDAGVCPAGYSPGAGACCVRDPTFTCVTRPAGCGAALTCACAAATLCPVNYTCAMTANDLVCTSPPMP